MKFSVVAVLLFICVTIGVVSGAPTDTEVVEVKDTDSEVLERHTREVEGACDCRLVVYDHVNFVGRSLLILQQNARFSNNWFDDRADSAKITGNCSWLLYQNRNFNRQVPLRQSYVLQPGEYHSPMSWGGQGNRITSARALPPNGTIAIALFQHTHFEGRMIVLCDSVDRFRDLDFNNQAGSAIVSGGTWQLYKRPHYKGEHTHLSRGHYPNLYGFRVGNDELSSIRLY